MLDAKDRKNALKALKENIKESFTNKMAHLFVIHVLGTLDDTTLLKKKIVAVNKAISYLFKFRNFSSLLMNLSMINAIKIF